MRLPRSITLPMLLAADQCFSELLSFLTTKEKLLSEIKTSKAPDLDAFISYEQARAESALKAKIKESPEATQEEINKFIDIVIENVFVDSLKKLEFATLVKEIAA